jgi:hypothetical protein
MSEPENFLSRWARLKRQGGDAAGDKAAEGEVPDGATPETTAKELRAQAPAPDASAAPAVEPAFDIGKLPPIESITATTDIRAFLAPGVPPDLARAALRRAWTADPAIRDFVGIAENQWDFNDPNGIPGFGSLGPLDDVRRMVAQVIGDVLDRSEDAAAVAEKSSAVAAADNVSSAAETQESAATEGDLPGPEDAQVSSTLAPPDSGSGPFAATQQSSPREPAAASAAAPPRRQHGGALPH